MNLGIHIGSITTGSPPLTQFQITQAFKMVLKNYFDTNFLSSSMYTTRAQLIMKLMLKEDFSGLVKAGKNRLDLSLMLLIQAF